MTANDSTKLTICQRNAPPGQQVAEERPDRRDAGGQTSDTSRTKPTPSTIVIDRKRRLRVATMPGVRIGRDLPDRVQRLLKLPEQARGAPDQRREADDRRQRAGAWCPESWRGTSR